MTDPIQYCHMKEFRTVYERKDPSKPKWIEVKLQVIVHSEAEAVALCERLTEHMDTVLPRFMQMTEQPIGEKP